MPLQHASGCWSCVLPMCNVPLSLHSMFKAQTLLLLVIYSTMKLLYTIYVLYYEAALYYLCTLL